MKMLPPPAHSNVLPFPGRSASPRQRILRPQWAKDPCEVLTVNVFGDSLLDEGIMDGDTLVLKRADESEVKTGDLVFARLFDRNIVRRIFFAPGQINLRSANPRHEDLKYKPGEIRVEGIVMELNRRLDLAS